MSTLSINGSLRRSIEDVLGSPTPTTLTYSLKLTSTEDTTLEWTALFMSDLSIVQDFIKNYGDDIVVKTVISPRMFLRLHEVIGSLEAALTVKYTGSSLVKKTLDVAPVVRKYRAMLIDPIDLRRRVLGAAGRVEDTMEIQIRLVDPLLYDVRQRYFHGTFKGSTIEEAIRYIAKAFGVRNLSLVQPDNVHVFDHIIIPPSMGFDDVWSYLQKKYGVYLKGLCAYITDDTLYIYPPFNHATEVEDKAHFYLDDIGGHAGFSCYHAVRDGIVSVVLDGNPDTIDLSQMGGENVGTAYQFSRSNQIVDGYMETTNYGSSFTNNTSMIISADGAKLASTGRSHIRQVSSATDNVFALTTNLVKNQAEIIHANWRQALPWLLKPGHAIKYMYDDSGILASTTGILDACAYDMKRIGPIGDGASSFRGIGRVRFRTPPDHT